LEFSMISTILHPDTNTGWAFRVGTMVCLAVGTILLCGAVYAAGGEGAGSDAGPAAAEPTAPLLDTGFNDLYELDFQNARAQFLKYQEAQPDDPLGKAAEAASYLYEEFNAKGVLTSEFFLDDHKLLGGVDGNPAANRNQPFLLADHEARAMAQRILKMNPQDERGLLALTMADGMESDYDVLIMKKPLAGLSLTKQAEHEATLLLAVDPSSQDAYVALGASNYVIGCLPGYKRAFLWFGGIHGDRELGMKEMQRAADNGHYLRPFAKILLALAYEREHQPERARPLLAQLAVQFPQNPLFAHELALLDSPAGN
jgi:hypothetical protein